MFKKLLFSSVAFWALALPAQAADLPSRKGPPPAPPAPIFTWTGFHIGYNSGYGGAVYSANVAIANPFLGTTTRTFDQGGGWFIGGQVGYDYQFANGVVLGLESDMQWSDLGSSHQATTTASAPLLFTYANTRQNLDWFGTTRGRLGFAFGRLLPYVTGGVAYGEVSANGVQALAAGLVTSGYRRSTNVGWTAGAGLDISLSNRLSARAEYLYLQLPGVSAPAAGLTAPPLPALVGSFSTGLMQAHMVRAGVNYHFGGAGDFLPEGGVLAMLFQKPEVDWTGFYVGVNGGYGGGKVGGVTAFGQPGLAFSTYASNRTGGAIAGGQIGYNYQLANQIVLGVESDAQWSGVKAWHQATTVGVPGGFVFTDTPNGMSWFGTTRARLGFASGRALAYATGGVAYGEITTTGLQFAGALFSGSGARTHVGWTVGGGSEYALTQNLSLKAEYLYVSLDGVSGPAVGLGLTPFAGAFTTSRFTTNVTRVGLNWRFGGAAPAPVAASY
ncbi:outer membrane protein [Methylocystis sp. Sn-Cys]|uniref:outer membrane protein n=1 Tax=Methylocystis sp. Sn-Cys TaxID=1701263 RepID=UPI0019248083|nr:outer membrane beta-barrel protein [Methylocystis sp. Sn-Cys]MBL1255595.1 porin family protein [Methylocystis sp. Sn-Cys]